jgi:hypothetical protein
MKKKSRKELAREIIAMLRHGMNRQPATEAPRQETDRQVPFTPMPMVRSKRTGQLQTSH